MIFVLESSQLETKQMETGDIRKLIKMINQEGPSKAAKTAATKQFHQDITSNTNSKTPKTKC